MEFFSVDERFPVTKDSKMKDLFSLNCHTALGHLQIIDEAMKAMNEGLDILDDKEDTDASRCLLTHVDQIEDESKEPANDIVDSDDEYVRGSNYSTLKQQRQMAEEVRRKHKKKTRRRLSKKHTESQDYMNTTWTELSQKRRGRKRHLVQSSIDWQAPHDTEQLPLPEAHDNSDIDSDKEFDTMSRSDWFGSPDSSSQDESDLEDLSNVDQFEKSSLRFDDGFDEIDEQEHRKPSHNKNHFTYPKFYSDEMNAELCRRNPLKFKKCRVRIESSHRAVCTNLEHSDDIQEIEISGMSRIGKVFNEDEVYVEVLWDGRDAYKNENYIPCLQKTLDLSKMSLKVFGQIRGVKQRHHYPDIDHPVFMCVLDESEFNLMLPISKTVPKIHILNRKSQNKYKVDVYRYVEDQGYLVHRELFDIKPGKVKHYIFLVALIFWENLYPLGAVIKVINVKDGLKSGMETLRLHHQVPTWYKFETVEQPYTWRSSSSYLYIFTCDKEGKLIEKYVIKKSIIRSRQKISYRQAQDVLLNVGKNVPDSICKQIKDMFIIAKSRRIRRLGSAMYHVPLETDDNDFMETKEAHFLVEEFMILANHTIGTYLLRKFQNCIPLRIQPPPEPKSVQQWLKSNEFIADLILKLQEVHPIPTIERERKLSVNTARSGRYNRVLMFQQHVWNSLLRAFREKDFQTVMQILGCDEIHPFACLGLEEWYDFQEKAEYKCSGDIQYKENGFHFSLEYFPIFTSLHQLEDMLTSSLKDYCTVL
ncbi:unnamed protein product [Mytilus edulis]|uniref:RNB domain-containing protein n=1 Tax=Mytilus edulis TaxID=6550 RepID=A0A8S3UWM6_MYTED|nr:unnamed protein product [Mytilus edulis]